MNANGTRGTILSNSFKENGHGFLMPMNWLLSCLSFQETLAALVADTGAEVQTTRCNVNVEVETTKTEAKAIAQEPAKPTNPTAVKKAVALGKDVRKQPEKTKADAAREMYALIAGEPREVIIQAFVDGAGLTPKGAQTYFYNCKRKAKKAE